MIGVVYLIFATFLAVGVVGDAFVDVPYNPSYVWVPPLANYSAVYFLSPGQSASDGLQLKSLDLSEPLDIKQPFLHDLPNSVPTFAGNSKGTVVPIPGKDGLPMIYAGDCQSKPGEVWSFVPEIENPKRNGEWRKVTVNQGRENKEGAPSGPNFLAAGVTFSESSDDPLDIFVLGGMCPRENVKGEGWVTAAKYSRDMLLLSSEGTPDDIASYESSAISMRSPPVAEAGFGMTSLPPSHMNSSTGERLTRQRFVLTGGHTQEAFINMSQVALFSLPETTWRYIPINQPPGPPNPPPGKRPTTGVEPRSGHTAALTPDGEKIIVLGGWVGETGVAAEPPLAILRLGDSYGGAGGWAWDVPEPGGKPNGLPAGTSLFGHGAAFLPGNIMLVVGGYEISAEESSDSKVPQSNSRMYLFNITSESWIDSYDLASQLEDSTEDPGPVMSSSKKTGLGVGIGVGVPAFAALAIALFCYRTRQSRAHRRSREQELRKLALGAERPHFYVKDDRVYQPITQQNTEYSPSRSPKRRNVEEMGHHRFGAPAAESAGLIRGTTNPRKGAYGSGFLKGYQPSILTGGPGGRSRIPPIEEGEEYEEVPQDEAKPYDGSGQGKDPIGFDAFIEPPSPVKASLQPPILPDLPLLDDRDAKWLEGIEPAMTHSGLHDLLGRRSTSPGKHKRTPSDLSTDSGSGTPESSHRDAAPNPVISSVFCPRHNPFSDINHSSYDSLQYGHDQRPRTPPSQATYRQSNESTAMTSPFTASDRLLELDGSPSHHYHGGGGSLMGRGPAWLAQADSSPKSSSGPKSKALEWAGNVRRAIGSIRRSEVTEKAHSVSPEPDTRTSTASPAKSVQSGQDEGVGERGRSTKSPRRAVSTDSTMLKRRQGARDWDVGKRGSADSSILLRSGTPGGSPYRDSGTSSGRNTVSPAYAYNDEEGDDDDYDDVDDADWDVEAAAEGRVVQVTFTVPKERLRVVNAADGDRSEEDEDYHGKKTRNGALTDDKG